ncbi:MAG: InlB B-repeat-containing protein, partial [Treponema sp.]|nr:InlB B-repeat-containing protein [Treponema sp.]
SASPQTIDIYENSSWGINKWRVGNLPKEPTRDGWIFIGWNTRADGKGLPVFEDTMVQSDITVYAMWGKADVTVRRAGDPVNTTCNDLEEAFAYINNAGSYSIKISTDQNFSNYNIPAGVKISLDKVRANITITRTAGVDFFTLSKNSSLTLGTDITLDGGYMNGCAIKIDSGGTFIMDNAIIKNFYGYCSTDAGTNGGAVYVGSNGYFIMNSGTIIGNTADSGGGVYIASGGNFTLNNGVINANTAIAGGGGVYNFGSVTMKYGNIDSNISSGPLGIGGGVVNNGSFIMEDGIISKNSAGRGGGVYIFAGGIFILKNGIIGGNPPGDGNRADAGGGVYNQGTFTMNSGSIYGNIADIDGGGGVYVSAGNFTMNNGIIYGNTALEKNGGGVYIDPSGVFIKSPLEGSFFSGVIYGDGDSVNPIFKIGSNTALNGLGNAVFADGSFPKKYDTTIGSDVSLNSLMDDTWE